MSLMDNLLGALGGALGGQSGSQGLSPVLQIALKMLAGGAQQGGGAGGQGGQGGMGGLGDLMSAFQKNGMGDLMQSWIGTGPNLPVSPDQMQQALGRDRIDAIARELGLSAGETSSGLAGVLPQLIDQLTPQGQAPSAGFGDLASIMQALAGGRRL